MSRTLVQPIGQKRLTNVAVVRLKKHGMRFEIACYKNKVLSWRSRVEKDLDEVLQSQTVYSNVSKGVLAKTKDLMAAFGTDDQTKICLEALEVIRELQKNFPIKRSPMRLRLTVPGENFHALSDKLNEWSATIVSKDESGSQLLLVCEIEPGMFRECDALVRNLQGRLEILAVSVHADGDTQVDYDEEDISSHLPKESADSAPSRLPQESTDSVLQLSEKMQKQTISSGNENAQGEVKQHKCGTCNAFVGDSKQYRDHFKSEWHKHNLKRKTRQLPPLTAEECLADMEMSDTKSDLQDYSF
ncbi:Ribosome maturation protein SBDS [Corchorus olitorius]|uniref:Ribosome maturation protein SBDS n=1 Tax=Corchorus olitorius TaxID=93759 RepID=A0A1R3GR83_9ROSI|nr:Ribosome maturation protein SBDS [Corchorus olitorius]